MVAETMELPNLRKMFLPDPEHIMIDCDLARADAQVVAWEADDEVLKQQFRENCDIHAENAKAVFRLSREPTYMERKKAKEGVHAVNYDVRAKTLSHALGTTVHEAEEFIERWLDAHPPIRAWHLRVKNEVELTRSISNKFGYRIHFFDRPDMLLAKALAWVPQSTVALVTNKGLLNIAKTQPEVDLLIQVHDSLVMQCHKDKIRKTAPKILENMHITIPYDDPLIIPVGLEASPKSWGDVKNIEKKNGELVWPEEFQIG